MLALINQIPDRDAGSEILTLLKAAANISDTLQIGVTGESGYIDYFQKGENQKSQILSRARAIELRAAARDLRWSEIAALGVRDLGTFSFTNKELKRGDFIFEITIYSAIPRSEIHYIAAKPAFGVKKLRQTAELLKFDNFRLHCASDEKSFHVHRHELSHHSRKDRSSSS